MSQLAQYAPAGLVIAAAAVLGGCVIIALRTWHRTSPPEPISMPGFTGHTEDLTLAVAGLRRGYEATFEAELQEHPTVATHRRGTIYWSA